MERRYRPRSFKERCNRARQRACGCRGNQRSVIEAAIAQSCGVGRDWHQHRLSPELALHDANGGLQPSAEWFCKRRSTVELQCSNDLAEPALMRANPCSSRTAGWRGTALHSTAVGQSQLAATLRTDERPLNAAGPAALRGEERQHWCCSTLQLRQRIAGTLGDLHTRTIHATTYSPRIGRYDRRMTSTTNAWTARTLPLAEMPASEWARLLATNPTASAFSHRAVHEAWWIGYGAEATDISLAVYDDAGALCAYLPLMLRPDGVRYLGATYHIDYATVLIDLSDAERATAAVDALVAHLLTDVTALDLRRLRRADHAHELFIDALTASGTKRAAQLSVEDPAPAIDLRNITTFDEHLERIDKKDRHEIRRKVRRGEGAGVTISAKPHAVDDLAEFITLHRARWGHHGLFTEDEKGARDETFMRELFARAPEGLITIIVARNLEFGAFAAGLFLRDELGLRYWNAGGELAARALSPGILLFAHGLQMAMSERKQVFDFLRGNEGYKYEVGAADVDVLMITVPAA
jgi:CelD/BcsL family acetyltransferase involved in cellulose biosynthesis